MFARKSKCIKFICTCVVACVVPVGDRKIIPIKKIILTGQFEWDLILEKKNAL